MLLSEMKEKQTATVVRVGGNGALRRRILEMGILKGTRVHVEKYAPLKDPVELIVNNIRYAWVDMDMKRSMGY